MSDYSQSTFFAPKDSLSSGDPLKVIKGSEVDAELGSISSALATKVDTAGTGLSLSSKTLSLNLTGLTAAAPAATDEFGFADSSDASTPKKVTLSGLETALNHDNLTGFVADEHVAHSGVTLTAGTGLSGGGTIAASRTFNLSINGLVDTTFASADYIAVYDTSISSHRRISMSEINHDSLNGFSALEHVNHGSVSITAGSGLTGGGTIAASRTINVGAGNGISVSADAVAMSGSYSGTFTATEVQATSDARLKENVQTISDPLGLLKGLRGTSYYHTSLDRDQYGVIAQEVRKVMPEAVGMDGDGYLSVSYAQITALLVEVCKGLVARVEALEKGA